MEQMDKHSTAEQTNSRRRFVKGTSAALVVSSLTSRSVFAQATETAGCTISGFQSATPSGVERHSEACGGFSQGAWGQPYANGNGSIEQWHAAGLYYYQLTGGAKFAQGFVPNTSEQAGRPNSKRSQDNQRFTTCFGTLSCPPTKWFDIFGSGGAQINSSHSLHNVLNMGGSVALDRDAAAAFLSSCWIKSQGFAQNFVDPRDIVILHNSAVTMPGGGGTLAMHDGNTISRPTKAVIHNFLVNLQYAKNA